MKTNTITYIVYEITLTKEEEQKFYGIYREECLKGAKGDYYTRRLGDRYFYDKYIPSFGSPLTAEEVKLLTDILAR